MSKKGRRGGAFSYFRYIILFFVLIYVLAIVLMNFYHERKPWRGGVGADNPKHSSSDWMWRLSSHKYQHPARRNASQCAPRQESGKNSMEKFMVQVQLADAKETGLLETGMRDFVRKRRTFFDTFQKNSH